MHAHAVGWGAQRRGQMLLRSWCGIRRWGVFGRDTTKKKKMNKYEMKKKMEGINLKKMNVNQQSTKYTPMGKIKQVAPGSRRATCARARRSRARSCDVRMDVASSRPAHRRRGSSGIACLLTLLVGCSEVCRGTGTSKEIAATAQHL